MKKILIISYFFPPSNLTGAYRVMSWAKHLNKFGYYPIIVTRRWDSNISLLQDVNLPSKNGTKHIKYDNYEVYYLPYYGNLRDKIYNKFGNAKFTVLRKFISLIELILQNFFLFVIPSKNLYYFSRQILKKDKDIKLIIASGRPYILYKFCYLLNKEFNVDWLADYRDAWTSSQWINTLNFVEKIINKLERRSEVKWVGSSKGILAVSEGEKENISLLVKKPGYAIMNGYEEEDFLHNNIEIDYNQFIITYNGSLYSTQIIDIFVEGLKIIAKEYRERIQIQINFFGAGYDPESMKRLNYYLKDIDCNYNITERISKEDALIEIMKSQVLLMFSHANINGVTSSKIFEYLAAKKNIILSPSDNDVLENLVITTRSGYICNTTEEVVFTLRKLINSFLENHIIEINSDDNKIKEYSRENQTRILAKVIDNVIDN